MRAVVTRRLKRWGVAVLAAVYAFGILAPTVAFAHADHASIVHVLTETHGGTLILHVHHDDPEHHHSGKTGSKLAHHCCGVISLPGLEPPLALALLQPGPARILVLEPEQLPSGCGLARLDRPPRLLLLA